MQANEIGALVGSALGVNGGSVSRCDGEHCCVGGQPVGQPWLDLPADQLEWRRCAVKPELTTIAERPILTEFFYDSLGPANAAA